MNFLKGTPFYSIFTGSCPVCQQESMYKNKNPFMLKQLFEMNERCSHCNTKYKIEPSFFYGAMYVSYGIGVALGVAVFIISFLFLLSRNIWINLFMKYDKNKSQINQNA